MPTRLDITKDIQSLTTFRRRSGDFLKQLKKTKRPVVLTVNGKAAAIVPDARAYQRRRDADVQLTPALRLKANIHVKALSGDSDLLVIGEAKLPHINHPVVVL